MKLRNQLCVRSHPIAEYTLCISHDARNLSLFEDFTRAVPLYIMAVRTSENKKVNIYIFIQYSPSMPRSILDEYSTSVDLTETGQRTLKIGEDNPIRISSGHRILHHEGKCSRPHGHNYGISIEVTGTLTDEGWIVDKGVVTDVIDEWDHRFLVQRGDPLIEAFEESGDRDALVVLEDPPTAEVMSVLLERRMLEAFSDNVSDVSVSVRETGELCATY